jgi:hypothetical protein
MLTIKVRLIKFSQEWEPDNYGWTGFLLHDGSLLSRLDRIFPTKGEAINFYRSVQSVISVEG